MKRYIRSNQHVSNYPEYIEVRKNGRDTWMKYKKLHTYVSDDGENCCYYTNKDSYSIATSWISLYPDGHLTFLWNGYEQPYNAEWRVIQ